MTIVLMPVEGSNDRKLAEQIENSILSEEQIKQMRIDGAMFLQPTDFMDMCNNQEINLEEYWVSYIKNQKTL